MERLSMRKIRKTVIFLLLLCILASGVPAFTAGAEWAPPTVPATSKAVYLVNSDTGTVLYSKNADEKVYPASITKLMTAILTVEKYKDNLDTVITVQKSDVEPLLGTGSSLMGTGLKANEQLTVRQLLYGLLLPSANDAAMVLARATGGSVENFVGMMNSKAKELGCKNTHYVNPHGLQDPEQYTTAEDAYLIAKYAMTFDILAQIVDTAHYTVQTNLQHYTLNNTDKMITPGSSHYYKNVKGIKTGSTDAAGDNFVSYATSGGITYYCVVMGGKKVDNVCSTAFNETKPLYTWAFSTFGIKNLVAKNSFQAQLPIQLAWNKTNIQLVADSQFNALIPNDTDSKLITLKTRDIPKSIMAPVKKGQKIGEADVMLKIKGQTQEQKLGTVALVASESVNRSQPLYFIYMVGRFFNSRWFKIISALLIFFLIVFFIMSYLRNRRRKMMNRRKRVYKLPK
jgi:D-alanyl-D-alanine carboxypeptidase (penicillin-binding protein 5/6)